MLPTPSTSHVPFNRVYEPAEDSFFLLDTLSSESEKAFISERFQQTSNPSSPVVVEIGTGSGVVLAFITAHARTIFQRQDILALGVDVNRHACKATEETVRVAQLEHAVEQESSGLFLDNVVGDLAFSLKDASVDLLIFNPPYVPTPTLPSRTSITQTTAESSWEIDSELLALSYAGGKDGMETTERLLDDVPRVLSEKGCAYVLLCAQNLPEQVMARIREWGPQWMVETVAHSGKKGMWEKLQIIRIWS